MKQILFGCALALMLSACGDKWEYKRVEVSGIAVSELSSDVILDPTDELNKLGEEGWELVTSYTEVETVHPNFGNDKYVTGLQPNTRTSSVCFILKRVKKGK